MWSDYMLLLLLYHSWHVALRLILKECHWLSTLQSRSTECFESKALTMTWMDSGLERVDLVLPSCRNVRLRRETPKTRPRGVVQSQNAKAKLHMGKKRPPKLPKSTMLSGGPRSTREGVSGGTPYSSASYRRAA
ncbi:hypothetical protein M440DRAFT_1453010 [Trichoderma longibrachiatum ATCC 18648]|uniref:Uncharacterized protein n=1 Tax=Trichoderma longibrachiatum ATCC 18648 TaxID=983965 RepID=A0A2T4CCR2_TRILO|nr:hypothetical protein M440DRAFT_1453010 [Trichoderma longibrachiatum ATCC 18648]